MCAHWFLKYEALHQVLQRQQRWITDYTDWSLRDLNSLCGKMWIRKYKFIRKRNKGWWLFKGKDSYLLGTWGQGRVCAKAPSIHLNKPKWPPHLWQAPFQGQEKRIINEQTQGSARIMIWPGWTGSMQGAHSIPGTKAWEEFCFRFEWWAKV